MPGIRIPTYAGDMADPLKPYGPNNPHPLSVVRTELLWEGKYDEYGNRRAVDTTGLAMPLQQIETIDEPRARAESQGGLFDVSKAHLDDFTNKLIWGDNLLVVSSLLVQYSGAVDLIYIDPPFDVGADFSMRVPVGDSSEEIEKEQSALEMVAYRDTWGKGTDSYLHMMYEWLTVMKSLLSERGSICVQCDWHVSAEIYPDVVDGLEEEGGVPSRLMKTDAGVGRQEGTPWEMFAGSMRIAPMRSRSRWMISREKARVA